MTKLAVGRTWRGRVAAMILLAAILAFPGQAFASGLNPVAPVTNTVAPVANAVAPATNTVANTVAPATNTLANTAATATTTLATATDTLANTVAPVAGTPVKISSSGGAGPSAARASAAATGTAATPTSKPGSYPPAASVSAATTPATPAGPSAANHAYIPFHHLRPATLRGLRAPHLARAMRHARTLSPGTAVNLEPSVIPALDGASSITAGGLAVRAPAIGLSPRPVAPAHNGPAPTGGTDSAASGGSASPFFGLAALLALAALVAPRAASMLRRTQPSRWPQPLLLLPEHPG